MNDPDAQFAAILGRKFGRLDWWRIKDEHSPYEWRLQKAMARVLPFDDERDDWRNAVLAAWLCASAGSKLDAEQFEHIRHYLPVNHQVQTVGPEGARAAIEG